ncbi:DoxX family membrane protein [Zhouia sp. PK063]|uniref:DoxX family membrane protein n=1 Tax=Zhouia sp. PK063 TaxID=3373602 RepID=UPI00378E689C
MKKEVAAYTLARLPIGFSFLGHGFIRIPKLESFSNGMVNSFQNTYLPIEIVKPFSLLLPFVELLLGIALIIGLKMKISVTVGVLLICILIFGMTFQENWNAIFIEMCYGLYFSILYAWSNYNTFLFARK